jgi:hypothetical protein
MRAIWSQDQKEGRSRPENRADGADNGTPIPEHIIVRGEIPSSLEILFTWTNVALRDTWSHEHKLGGVDPEIEPTVPIMALRSPNISLFGYKHPIHWHHSHINQSGPHGYTRSP